MEALRQTTALCLECDIYHPADVISRADKIWGIVHCPKGEQEYLISSNAQMYVDLSRKSFIDPSTEPRKGFKPVLNYISITNACNFYCAVCAASAGGKKNTFLSVDEIVRRAKEIRKSGSATVRLFGGEPTIHPEIHSIIKKLTRMGLQVWMLSNGYLLGKDSGLALGLKKYGLKGVCLQFDSLNSLTLDFLCRNYLDEKNKAIHHVIKAGLNLGFNCTITNKNLSELSSLLKKEISLGSNIRHLIFGSAAPVGRFDISPGESVDREQIISSFLNDQKAYFSLEDIFPLPSYAPWGAQIHPDCGAHVVLVKTPSGIKPLNHFLDVQKLYSLMGKSRASCNFFSAKMVPLYYVFMSLRKKMLRPCLKLLIGLLFFKKRYYLLNVTFVDYRGKRFLDQQRLSRCAAAFHTSIGPVSACLYFYQGANTPGTLAYETAHGSC